MDLLNGLGGQPTSKAQALLIAVVIVWTMFWKGWALWTSAQEKKKWWFLAILIINTFGILEIVYLFGFAKKKMKDFQNLFTRIETKKEEVK